MNLNTLLFKDKKHQDAFNEMVEEMYLSEKEIQFPERLLKKQLAFIYLIALYQADCEKYEGERFYIESGEEISIGGPTYLMDERYGKRTKDYEKMVLVACEFLKEDFKGSNIKEFAKEVDKDFEASIAPYLEQAIELVEDNESYIK